MTTITDFPAIRPSFLLDFANSGRVDPRISCARASTATCYGCDGKLRTVAANVPRIDYNPATGKCLGLLEVNPRHRSLNTHKYGSLRGIRGEEVFEAYAENKTPAAFRVFWHYGPDKKTITVIAITPHP